VSTQSLLVQSSSKHHPLLVRSTPTPGRPTRNSRIHISNLSLLLSRRHASTNYRSSPILVSRHFAMGCGPSKFCPVYSSPVPSVLYLPPNNAGNEHQTMKEKVCSRRHRRPRQRRSNGWTPPKDLSRIDNDKAPPEGTRNLKPPPTPFNFETSDY
jgi:hypothetical protein